FLPAGALCSDHPRFSVGTVGTVGTASSGAASSVPTSVFHSGDSGDKAAGTGWGGPSFAVDARCITQRFALFRKLHGLPVARGFAHFRRERGATRAILRSVGVQGWTLALYARTRARCV